MLKKKFNFVYEISPFQILYRAFYYEHAYSVGEKEEQKTVVIRMRYPMMHYIIHTFFVASYQIFLFGVYCLSASMGSTTE